MTDAKPLHVVHIASGDLWAGAEVQLFTLAKTLHRETHTAVSVVLLNHGRLEDELRAVGIPVSVLDESQLNGLQILRRLVSLLKQLKPDVVHTHRMKENVLGSIAAWIAGRIPSLRTVHGAPEHAPSWRQAHKRLFSELDRLAGRHLQSRIVAVSNPLAQELGKTFPPAKIAVIENGVDIAALEKYRRSRESRNAEPDRPARIGIAGRLVPVKRVDLFLETARLFLDRHPEIPATFHIFGDGPLRAELEALRMRLDLAEAVTFEGHCDDMPAQLAELDVLMMTSDHEGLPMVLLEAMAVGVPVVAHGVGGITEALENGACGTLVTEHKAAGYCRELYEALANAATSGRHAEQAAEGAGGRYSALTQARQHTKNYHQLAHSTSANSCHSPASQRAARSNRS